MKQNNGGNKTGWVSNSSTGGPGRFSGDTTVSGSRWLSEPLIASGPYGWIWVTPQRPTGRSNSGTRPHSTRFELRQTVRSWSSTPTLWHLQQYGPGAGGVGTRTRHPGRTGEPPGRPAAGRTVRGPERPAFRAVRRREPGRATRRWVRSRRRTRIVGRRTHPRAVDGWPPRPSLPVVCRLDRVTGVVLFAGLDREIEPVLYRNQRALVGLVVRTRWVVRRVEVEHPPVPCSVAVRFEVEVPARTVGLLVVCVVPERHPEPVLVGVAPVRLEPLLLAGEVEPKLAPAEVLLLAAGRCLDGQWLDVVVPPEPQFEPVVRVDRVVRQPRKPVCRHRRVGVVREELLTPVALFPYLCRVIVWHMSTATDRTQICVCIKVTILTTRHSGDGRNATGYRVLLSRDGGPWPGRPKRDGRRRRLRWRQQDDSPLPTGPYDSYPRVGGMSVDRGVAGRGGCRHRTRVVRTPVARVTSRRLAPGVDSGWDVSNRSRHRRQTPVRALVSRARWVLWHTPVPGPPDGLSVLSLRYNTVTTETTSVAL